MSVEPSWSTTSRNSTFSIRPNKIRSGSSIGRFTHFRPSLASIIWLCLRYHNWLNQLPDTKQDELTALPPNERMAAVKKLIADYPQKHDRTLNLLRSVDVGEYSPFELASFSRSGKT